nr:MAG TPA: hypothetical protein [Caudoviricetes sp.]
MIFSFISAKELPKIEIDFVTPVTSFFIVLKIVLFAFVEKHI